MNGQPAIVLMEHELQHMLTETAKQAAKEVISEFKSELQTDQKEVITRKLRAYIEDRSTISDPRTEWANGLHIRSIKLNGRDKPRSQSWLQQFKVNSGLRECIFRKSRTTGGNQEWCFEDIANAWEVVQF